MSQWQLLKKPRFYPLFWTQFLGAFNDNFLKNALVILIAFRGIAVMGIPPSQMVVLAGGIFILPFFLFSASAGQLADKYEKSKIIRVIKSAEIAIMILAACGFVGEQPIFLLVVLFLMSLHSTYFGPIKYSILPQHLAEDELVAGNALIEAGTFLGILLGTITGGTLISLAQGPWIVSAGLILVAIGGYGASRAIPEAAAVSPRLQVNWNPVTPTGEILRLTRSNRVVFLAILGISWFWFFGAAMLSLFPTYGKDVLRGDEHLVTLFLACFSVGIGAGSLLCEKLSRRRLELGLVPLGSIGITLFTIDLFLVGTPVEPWGLSGAGLRIIADLLLLSIFSGLYIVPLYTLVQERSDPAIRSRIIAGNNILNAFFMVLASGVLMALMVLRFSVPQIFLVLSLLNGVVAIYIYTLLPEFLFRFVMWVLANVMYRMKVEGQENIPLDRPAVIVCNHVSFVDWLIVGAAVPRPVHFVMHYTYARGWLARRVLARAKVILIAGAREDARILTRAFEQIRADLGEGDFVGIFPEGSITRDGKLGEFRPGVMRVLRETPVTVIPMALNGMWGSFFSRERGRAIAKVPRRFWSRVTLRIGKPIPPEKATAAELRAAVAALMD